MAESKPISSAAFEAAVRLAIELAIPVHQVPRIAAAMQDCAAAINAEAEDAMTVEEVAAARKVSPDLIIKHCQSGRLPADDLGTGSHHLFRIMRRNLAALRYSPHRASMCPIATSGGRRRS
jgi:hypothetical protein